MCAVTRVSSVFICWLNPPGDASDGPCCERLNGFSPHGSVVLAMVAPDTIALAARAADEGLQAILVGGNAVNLHGYFRTTFDVDLLIPEEDAERWLAFFVRHG